MKCLNCQTSIINKRTGTSKDGQPVYRKFCNRSCSTTYNNRKQPKRQPEGTCTICSKRVRKGLLVCLPCRQGRILNTTIKELKGDGNSNYKSRYPYIRDLARSYYRSSGRPMTCCLCGYDKHVDICHIRDIKSYDLNTTIGEVNSPMNLLAMCKNHHWELDNNLL